MSRSATRKDQILEYYLNTIYFGHGAYGVESASQAYFGKTVSKLTLAESAMIAGVIKSPGRYSPYLDQVAAKQRRDTVLAQMRDEGYITPAEFDDAVAEPRSTTVGLKRPAARPRTSSSGSRAELETRFGAGPALPRRPRRQDDARPRRAEGGREGHLLDTRTARGDPSAALVAIKPGTGEVVAMVGGRDFKTQQFNAAVQGNGRQPGSSFKPFVLATALGDGVSPEQTFKSGAAKLAVRQPDVERHRRPRRLRRCDAPARRDRAVGELRVRPPHPRGHAREGRRDRREDGPALGHHARSRNRTRWTRRRRHAAGDGRRVRDARRRRQARRAVRHERGRDAEGQRALLGEAQDEEAIDPAVAYLTTDILKGVIKRGTGTAASIGRPAAGKTGTTQEYRDAWFVGYTPQLATAVWMGYPEAQTAMTNVHGRAVTGGSFPAQMWAKFMRAALAEKAAKDFTRPERPEAQDDLPRDRPRRDRVLPARRARGCSSSSMELKSCTKHTAPKKINVPNLVGMTKEAALAALEKLKLAAKVVEKSVDGVAAGVVAGQTPAAGSTATTQTVVTLTVSNGGVSNAARPPTSRCPATPSPGRRPPSTGRRRKTTGRS